MKALETLKNVSPCVCKLLLSNLGEISVLGEESGIVLVACCLFRGLGESRKHLRNRYTTTHYDMGWKMAEK